MHGLKTIVSIEPLGDSALLIEFNACIDRELNQHIHSLVKQIKNQQVIGITDLVPSYHSLAVFYQPGQLSIDDLKHIIFQCQENTQANPGIRRQIEIPVCYQPDYAPDLELLAAHCQLTVDEVIKCHSQATYDVYFLGFKPGFGYLGGLDKSLEMPRKTTPRLQVPAGSVGIGGQQTGIYPQTTPGGWQIIGRTPLKLFDSTKTSPCFLQPGDSVRFVPITWQEFTLLAGQS